jgi:hypothetical protein
MNGVEYGDDYLRQKFTKVNKFKGGQISVADNAHSGWQLAVIY